MAAIYADPDIPASGPRAPRQRLEACLRALEACGWERLAPLAQHMVAKHLVRARGDADAPSRRLEPHVLREALSRLLRDEWEHGYLAWLPDRPVNRGRHGTGLGGCWAGR
jgi:hypothetical protein